MDPKNHAIVIHVATDTETTVPIHQAIGEPVAAFHDYLPCILHHPSSPIDPGPRYWDGTTMWDCHHIANSATYTVGSRIDPR